MLNRAPHLVAAAPPPTAPPHHLAPPTPLSSMALVGWYSGEDGNPTDIDHIVSLNDAYISGGSAWSSEEKRTFSNDPYNQVASNPYVNRVIKNKHTPLKFITRMLTSNYGFASGKCLRYLDRYAGVKTKYGLKLNLTEIESASHLCMTL